MPIEAKGEKNMPKLFKNILRQRNANVINALASSTEVLAYPIIFFLAAPLLIDRLGEVPFGIWQNFTNILITLNFFVVGIHESGIYLLAKAHGRSDQDYMRHFLGSQLGMAVLFWMVAASALFMVWGVGWQSIFPKFNFQGLNTFAITIYLAGILLCRFLLQVFFSLYKALERYEIAAAGSMATRVLSLLGAIYAAFAGWSLENIFFIQMAIHLLVTLLFFLIARRWIPGNLPMWQIWALFRQTWGIAKWMWGQSFLGMAFLVTDRMLVAFFAGPVAVGYYTLIATMFNHIHMAYEASASWVFPKISKWKEGKLPVQHLYDSMNFLMLLLGIVSLLLLAFVEKWLFGWWLGEEKYAQMAAFIPYFIVVECFYLQTVVNKFYLNAAGDMRFNTWLELGYKSSIVLSMTLTYLITKNIYDMLTALSISAAISLSVYLLVIHRRIHLRHHWGLSLLQLAPSWIAFLIVWFAQPITTLLLIPVLVIIFDRLRKKYLHLNILKI